MFGPISLVAISRRTGDQRATQAVSMLNVNIFCFFASYLVAFGLELTRLRGWTRFGRWLTLGFATAGFFAHTMYLLSRAGETQLPPLLSSPQDWLLVLTWMVVATYVLLSWIDGSLGAGLLVLPTVLLVTAAAWFVRASPEVTNAAPRSWTMLHVSLLVLGTLGVLSGFLISLMYLWQHWRLKHVRQGQTGLTLPSLERLERLNRIAVMSAVPLFTLGLLTGIILTTMSSRVSGYSPWTDPLAIVGITGWGVLCALFAKMARAQHHPGRRVAWLTVWSCGFLLLAFVGIQVVTSQMKVYARHGTGLTREVAP